jgi:DNA modification methylase
LSDPNDLISYGTSGKISNLMSSMDFRENIIRTNSNNMEKLRRECSDKGFHLTHGAAFPLTIPLILLLTTTKPGDTVLDIYSGTATAGEAAAMTGRKYIGYEIKPEYIMASEVRLAEYLGNDGSNLLAA